MFEKTSDKKTFAQFLDEQPAPAETVTVVGYVSRGDQPGSFVLSAGGQTIELNTDAVKSYTVLSEGAPKVVQLEIHKAKLPQNNGTGAQPFVLATPHHAPEATITAQLGGAAFGYANTTPIRDLTLAWTDTYHSLYKEVAKDPITDTYTLPENILNDPTNSAVEGAGSNWNPGNVVNPAQLRMFAAPMQPTQPVSPMVAPSAPGHSAAFLDVVHTGGNVDSLNTIKELAKDPLADPITWVESHGGFYTNPVWGLPGMMY